MMRYSSENRYHYTGAMGFSKKPEKPRHK